MSSNQSWFNSGKDYFADGKVVKLVGKLIVLLIVFAITFNYFKKANERNMVLNQSDILHGKGMSKEVVDFRKANKDQEPLWSNSMFGGMPAYHISTWYHGNLFNTVDDIMNLRFKIKGKYLVSPPIGNMFLLFVSMFILLCTLKIDPITCAVGAFAFMMSSYFFVIMGAGHNSQVNAVAYMPMVIAGVLLLYRGRYWLGTGLSVFALALEINANHFQITYYGLLFIVAPIVISELARNVNAVGKGILFTLLFGVLTSWALKLPSIVWKVEVLLAFTLPLGLSIFSEIQKGNKLMALIKGKGITESAEPKRRFVLASLLLILALGMSGAPNIGRLMTTNEYAKETMRGGSVLKSANGGGLAEPGLNKEYAYRWSYGTWETMTLINPFYMGDASYSNLGENSATYDVFKDIAGAQSAKQIVRQWPTYNGDMLFTSGPVYAGVVICFLFVLGLFVVSDRYRWWLLGATVIGIMLSWGRHFQWFSDLFFDNAPLYHSFRAVSMMMIIAEITLPILAALALYHIYKNPKRHTPKQQATFIGIAGGLVIFLLLILMVVHPGVDLISDKDPQTIARITGQLFGKQPDPGLVNQLVDALESDRASMISSQAWKGILLVILTAGALVGYVLYLKDAFKNQSRTWGVVIVSAFIFGLVAWDMIPVDKRYINDDSFVKQSTFLQDFNPSVVDKAIKQDPDPDYRVLKLGGDTWNDATTSYHHKSIGGYHPAKFRRYQDLIDRHLIDEIDALLTALNTQDSTQMLKIDAALKTSNVLNMLNCKYFILGNSPNPLPNRYALGHAWVVGNYEVLPTPDAVIAKLGTVNLSSTMLVEEKSAEELKGFQASMDSSATITMTHWQSNENSYSFNSTSGKEQLVVFSEIYYNSGKGWQAYLDGQKVPHFRCDYTLRGMKVPAGKHEIVFKFEPATYYRGETLSLIFSIVMFLVILGAVTFEILRGGKDDEDDTEGTTFDTKA